MFRKLHHYIRKSSALYSSRASTIISLRNKFLSPSLTTFQAYDEPVILKSGNKCYLKDIHGNKYIDLLGQNLCISVGYNNKTVLRAATKQMRQLSHCTTMYHHEESARLAEELVQTLPSHPSGEDWVVHLVNDGSEAVDLAIQMARIYTGRPEIYSLHKSYHGLHGYAAAVTAIGKATQPSYSSMFTSIKHICPNDLEQLENSIKYGTNGSVGGIIIEPLQGYGGIYPLDTGYMKDAFELINRHKGVTIADEVQTGYGRCGESFWGFQMKHNNAIPDMITIAKGMGNGVGIIGGVICRRSIAEAFTSKMFFNTYGANPTASAAARAVLKVIRDEDIVGNCNRQGLLFTQKLTELCNKYPGVYSDNRGSGLFQGLEIYGKTEKESQDNAIKLHRELLNYKVIAGRGSAAGNVIRIQPPMCITKKNVLYVIEALECAANHQVKTK